VPESSIVVRPEPMESGSYTAASRLRAAGLLGAIKLFEEAANAVPLPKPPQPIVIADYGASTAHNSLLPICAAIAVLRKRTRPEHSVLVAHTDVADNDFTVLFQTLADDPDSYLKKDAASFASAIGRSVVLHPDPAVQQRQPRLDVVGHPMAQPGAYSGA
jgi:salicylate 1-O-methyltransferase